MNAVPSLERGEESEIGIYFYPYTAQNLIVYFPTVLVNITAILVNCAMGGQLDWP